MIFNGKTALVTGASRGIGRAIALELARQGMVRLVLVGRDRERLKAVATEVAALGAEAIPLALDLTDPVAVNIAIAQVWKQAGPIYLLVNCAGVAHQTAFLNAKLPEVKAEIDTNLMGLYSITRLLARRMARRQAGHIVNVSSLMGKIPAPTMATYSATKFAIVGFTQALRHELAPYNVQVSALLPSLTTTDMVRSLRKFRWVIPSTPEQVAQKLVTGLQYNRSEILVGWQSYLAVWFMRLMPGLSEQLIRQAAPTAYPGHPFGRIPDYVGRVLAGALQF